MRGVAATEEPSRACQLRWPFAIVIFGALAACGGGGNSTAPPVVAGPPAQMVAVAADPSDLVVAKVAGRPVWGSCVAAQVARGAPSREQALRECVDFELLAQEAERRGLDSLPEVVEATRTALVGRLVDRFEDRYPDPASMHDEIVKTYQSVDPASLVRPEHRESWNMLVHLPDHPSADLDRRGREFAEKVDRELIDETGLFHDHLEAAAKKFPAGDLDIIVQRVPPTSETDPGLLPEYRGALFAIPEVGRVSPVTKSQFGYHVILLTEVYPAVTLDLATAEPRIFAELRRNKFKQLVDDAMANLPAPPQINDTGLEASP